MREFRPMGSQQKKLKPSKFYDNFVQAKGPNGVAMASTGEIQKNLKMFFTDLAYGNIVQDKYTQFILGDPRVFQEAITECQNKLEECTVVIQSLDFAAQNGLPITTIPAFQAVHNKTLMKANTYGVILQGISAFLQSVQAGQPDFNHLVSISVRLGSVMMKGSRMAL